jgi:hypothetical protein
MPPPPAPPGMPAPQPAAGMGAPQANVGPGTTPTANHGNMAAARLDVNNGLKLLQRALPNIPMGSPLHTDILSTVAKIAKHMAAEGGGDQGLHASGMMQAMRQNQQQAPQIAALRSMQAPAGPPATFAPANTEQPPA